MNVLSMLFLADVLVCNLTGRVHGGPLSFNPLLQNACSNESGIQCKLTVSPLLLAIVGSVLTPCPVDRSCC